MKIDTSYTSLILGLLMSALSMTGFAQSGLNPAKDDIPESKKIYSPYVERTASDKNFAEGLYWGDPIPA